MSRNTSRIVLACAANNLRICPALMVSRSAIAGQSSRRCAWRSRLRRRWRTPAPGMAWHLFREVCGLLGSLRQKGLRISAAHPLSPAAETGNSVAQAQRTDSYLGSNSQPSACPNVQVHSFASPLNVLYWLDTSPCKLKQIERRRPGNLFCWKIKKRPKLGCLLPSSLCCSPALCQRKSNPTSTECLSMRHMGASFSMQRWMAGLCRCSSTPAPR